MVILTLWVLVVNNFAGILIENFGVYATNMTADRIISLTNEERVKKGLSPVKSNAYLTSAAHAKANDMFNKGYWDHFGPNGESPWDFIKESGYVYVYAGENLGKGFTTAEGVHQAWMASPTHRDNILSSNYQDIGIAIVSGELQGEHLILVVQMFGSISVPHSAGEEQPRRIEYVRGDSEDGKTKSIRIVYPEEGLTYTDPQIPVKGETKNFDSGSIVQIIKDNLVIGETEVKSDNLWEFNKSSDWQEGRNYIDAVVLGGSEKHRDSVSFFINSQPPEVLGVYVEDSRGNFNIDIRVDKTAEKASLVLGADIKEAEVKDGVVKFTISEEELVGSVFLVITDIHGNFVQQDITSHFISEEKDEKGSFSVAGLFSVNISSMQRFITVFLAILILLILLMQIYFYNREDRLRERSGDFLVVGIWWLLFLFGSFVGYSGSIY